METVEFSDSPTLMGVAEMSAVCNTGDSPWKLIPDRIPWAPQPSPWIQPGPLVPGQPFQPVQPTVPWINPDVVPLEPDLAPGEFRIVNGGDLAGTVGALLEMLASGGLTVEQYAKLAESGDCEHIVAFLRALEKRRSEDDEFNVELDQEMMK